MAGLRFAVQGRGAMAARMRALIGDVDPADADAIYIASRNRDHAAQSIAALRSGKAMLCEKPFAMTPDEADEIITISKQNSVLYMEAVATPFLPAVATALEAARSGQLGRLRRFEASFGYAVDRAVAPRLFDGDGGVLADRAVYPLMLALIAMGPVRASRSRVERDPQGLDIAAHLILDHDAGGTSELAVSFAERLDNSLRIEGDTNLLEVAPPLLGAQRISLGGRRGSPGWRRLRQQGVVRRAGDIAARIGGGWHPYGISPYRHEIAHFEKLFRAGAIESPVVSHARMRAVAGLVDEARRS